MTIQAIYEKEEDIPEAHKELYTERDGKWEITEVEGMKTAADVTRVQEALNNEKRRHSETVEAFKPWKGLGIEFDDVRTQLDSIPDLQAQIEAAGDGVDEEKINNLVQTKLQGELKPIQRELDKTKEDLSTVTAERDGLLGEKKTRIIHDAVRASATELKVIPEAMEDVLMHAERIMEINDENAVITRDNVGVTPMVSPQEWLTDLQDKKPHWFPGSQGGGAGGSGDKGGQGGGSHAPWTFESWNVMEQNRLQRELGSERAGALAKRAGTTLGGPKPAPAAK